jgi:hypothetical protein
MGKISIYSLMFPKEETGANPVGSLIVNVVTAPI